jgi:hypothetical protein
VWLQILEGGDPAEVERVGQLLEYVDAELLGNCNFEFLQVVGLPQESPCADSRVLVSLRLKSGVTESKTWYPLSC